MKTAIAALAIAIGVSLASPATAAVRCADLAAAQTEVGILLEQVARGDINPKETIVKLKKALDIPGLDPKDVADITATADALHRANADAAMIKKTVDERLAPRFASAKSTCTA